MPEHIVLAARTGRALRLASGASARIVNTCGQQVVDTWAFAADDFGEFMSMEHSRVHMGRIAPRVGSTLLTNRRRPILTMTEDTSGGVHDTLMAACDVHRYRMLGCAGHHDNCTDNLHAALAAWGSTAGETPCPLNLFQNSRLETDGTLAIAPPIAAPGSHVALRAEMDLILVLSACPQDMAPTNGAAMTPRSVAIELG